MSKTDTRSGLVTTRQATFSSLLEDYIQTVKTVINKHQKQLGAPDVEMKQEIFVSFGMSADLARKVANRTITETCTMQRCLDILENILNIYDSANQEPERNALLKRKNYFFKKYVIRIPMDRPIIQRNRGGGAKRQIPQKINDIQDGKSGKKLPEHKRRFNEKSLPDVAGFFQFRRVSSSSSGVTSRCSPVSMFFRVSFCA